MAEAPQQVIRPDREPFDPNMTEEDAGKLLRIAPFCDMDPHRFSKINPLRTILHYDCSIRTYRIGEIILRQGDYGASAFMVLEGEVQVVRNPPLPPAMLGRPETRKRNVFRLLAQLWSHTLPPETAPYSRSSKDLRFGVESDESDRSRVYLQDIPRILSEHEKIEPMKSGEFFGEIAALTRQPRSAKIFANTEEVKLLEIRWQGLNEL